MSAYTPDGWRVASEDELAAHHDNLCEVCTGEPRQAARYMEVAAFADDDLLDAVCRPCAIYAWGCRMLEGRTPPAADRDRTLRSREMVLLIFASWMLRRAVVR